MEIFRLYVQVIRPCIGASSNPSASVFVKYDGMGTADFGKHVFNFFQQHGLHIGSNTIRSVWETTATEAFDDDRITSGQRRIISTINGHSGKTAKQFYVRRLTGTLVNAGRKAGAIISGDDQTPQHDRSCSREVHDEGSPNDDHAFEEAGAFAQPPPTAYIVWGQDHPSSPEANKAVWSPAELKYIKRFAKAYQRRYPEGQRLVKDMLEQIRGDEAAHRIFHARHVLKSDRLRTGVNRASIDDIFL